MKTALKIILASLLALTLLAGGAAFWYVWGKLPQRSGDLGLARLKAPVSVRYDERGVPHIKAANADDLYRALGYVHAQDRLFQMEMLRRLARGELAEVLGPERLKSDRLFRTLGLADHAKKAAAAMDPQDPAVQATLAYLDGINQFQASRPAPMEFDLLHLPKRNFTLPDVLAVSGYMAYSFASALKTEPALTYVRNQLGPDYLRIFDLEWHALGVLEAPPAQRTSQAPALERPALEQLARLGTESLDWVGAAAFEGSNAWAVSGAQTSSGQPLLAGDPHIGYSLPGVWYEAHLSSPGFALYGHFMPLIPMALLGHNMDFGWSLTMFQNDDMDLVAEQRNPQAPEQVRYHDQWVPLASRVERIKVKGAPDVNLTVQSSPHGPLIHEAMADTLKETQGDTPIALWWTFLQADNPLLQAFYALNRADTLAKARAAARQIAAPGLNIVWANARGDIGWWAAARLPIRYLDVNPSFILDGSTGEADKLGWFRFSDNPQEENPARGYIVSANQQPISTSGLPIPGYYNAPHRAQALQDRLANKDLQWNPLNSQSLQLSTQTAYFWRVLEPLMPTLSQVIRDPLERSVFDSLAQWDGQYTVQNIPPTVFTQFLYELARGALADELGSTLFRGLMASHAVDQALARLAADEESPWWDDARTPAVETRADIVRAAWRNTVNRLKDRLGTSPNDWGWGAAHTLTFKHPLGSQWPLGLILNVGPFAAPGAREVPNQMGGPVSAAPWDVVSGPSVRRIIDFADASQARGILPLGQSGVPFDRHYKDQAPAYMAGGYLPMYLSDADVQGNTRDLLTLRPGAP
ncbi:MAG: penicillin acylase family protein [Rhodoferax sp.]